MESPKIRPEQEAAFRRQAMENFEDRAVAHLRSQLAEATSAYSEEELRERVRTCTTRAVEYGLTTQQQILCFVDASYLLDSPEFDRDPKYPWAGRVLRSDSQPAGVKASVILSCSCSVRNAGSAHGE